LATTCRRCPMPQPVKLSDPLVNAAREASELAHRSLAAQVEHWATLGRAIEGKLTADQSASLKYAVRESAPTDYKSAGQFHAALASALAAALSPSSRRSFAAELAHSPEPLYSADPALPGCIVRENPDGTRTPGHWRDGQFMPLRDDPQAGSATARSA
jgi:ParD-like antitoxin of type II bacterial toxin-antitoxin system